MKKLLSLFCVFYLIFSLSAQELDKVDQLHNNGKFGEALSLLQTNFDKSNPDPAYIWRMGRELYEDAKIIKSKKEKLSKLEEGQKILEPYYNLKNGSPRDRATLIFWYAVFSSEMARTKGIKESLDNIPNLFKYCNESISIDKEYGDPYYLKAMINDGLPTLFGGDKVQMSLDITKAISMDSDNYTYLVDGATAFLNRNWDIKKKSNECSKKGISNDGSPADLSDKEYAKSLLEKAIKLSENDHSKTYKDKIKIEEGKKLLLKL